MNEYPNLHTIVLYTRNQKGRLPDWSSPEARYIERIRSSHTHRDGKVMKAHYTIQTSRGEIVRLIYNREELLWSIQKPDGDKEYPLPFVLAHSKPTLNVPSFDHRLIPYRFLMGSGSSSSTIEQTPVCRMQPFRFLKGRHSMQVKHLRCRHTEDLRITRHLHYVVKTDQDRYFNLVYVCNEAMWKFIQEVDGVLFFDE